MHQRRPKHGVITGSDATDEEEKRTRQVWLRLMDEEESPGHEEPWVPAYIKTAAFRHFLRTKGYVDSELTRLIDNVSIYRLTKQESLDIFLFVLQRVFERHSRVYSLEFFLGYAFWPICRYGRRDFLRELLKLNEARDALYCGPFDRDYLVKGLRAALEEGHAEFVRHLLVLCGNSVYDRVNVFRFAFAAGARDIVEALLQGDEGAVCYPELEVSEGDVRAAAESHHGDIVKLLLAHLPALDDVWCNGNRMGWAVARLFELDGLCANSTPPRRARPRATTTKGPALSLAAPHEKRETRNDK